MRPTVSAAWKNFNSDLEGVYSCPYADVKRLVSTAMGILIDPIERALPFQWKIGERDATVVEIRDDWQTIKDMARAKSDEEMHRWTANEQAQYTSIRLRAEEIDRIVSSRLHANVDYITKHYFLDFEEWPADAQMGALSLCWGVGAGLTLTNPPRTLFVESARARNWDMAKVHARLRTAGNAGVVARNAKQDVCFNNARLVEARRLDPAQLWWPGVTPADDDLHTLALKALELGIARDDGEKS